ncbi:MAG TPA: chemotaxis protein CheW [Pirellulales bacterium]|jgi:chemotaxis signal transduction protein|nr:chemotaxis protein CheW [Pirellulales bacterium]
MISTTKQFDWDSIKRRLGDGQAALDRAAVASESQLDEVYRQRQLAYAQRTTSDSVKTETRRVLVFLLGRERYAIELPAVVKVFPLSQCTPVPGASQQILGIINVSGDIRSVLDAANLLGLASNDDRVEGHVILLRHANFEVGLRVDRVEAIEAIDIASLSHPEDTEAEPTLRYVEGVTPESLIVLSMRQLMSHSAFQSTSLENEGTEHDHW